MGSAARGSAAWDSSSPRTSLRQTGAEGPSVPRNGARRRGAVLEHPPSRRDRAAGPPRERPLGRWLRARASARPPIRLHIPTMRRRSPATRAPRLPRDRASARPAAGSTPGGVTSRRGDRHGRPRRGGGPARDVRPDARRRVRAPRLGAGRGGRRDACPRGSEEHPPGAVRPAGETTPAAPDPSATPVLVGRVVDSTEAPAAVASRPQRSLPRLRTAWALLGPGNNAAPLTTSPRPPHYSG